MEFSNITIKKDSPLIIPEIGINHGGDLDVAKSMVDSAARAGAIIVKHQTHIPEEEMSIAAKNIKPGNSNKDIYSVISENCLGLEEEIELAQYVRSKNIEYLSTPFSIKAAEFLAEKINVSCFKIGSGECSNRIMIREVAKIGKPMIVSTGMNTLASVRKTVEIMEEEGVQYALMHTTNLYPTPYSHVRLGAMMELMREFSNIPVGLSDHTLDSLACISALALGAQIIERHFTDHKNRVGPDIICSMDENELAELIESANKISMMLGGSKEPHKDEQVTIDFAFTSIVSKKKIFAGELITKDNICLKRPGTGEFNSDDYLKLLGKKVTTDVEIDIQIKKEFLEN